jgi:NAD(P)-dependent dehydrogenase (short-subunit alcohol dehydrogenase family)
VQRRRGARPRPAIAWRSRTSQDAGAADAVVQAIADAGGHAVAIRADVTVEADVVALFARAKAELGAVDVLVNNAGIVDVLARVEDMSEARLVRMFQTNVVGSFLCAREAIRAMSTRRGGSGGAIVNVSSAAARLGSAGDYVDYAASKATIDTFTIGLAREVAADGIRVNAVRPGVIDTEIHAGTGHPDRARTMGPSAPLGRAGRAHEVAAAILWLASDEASYVTGAILDVTGGR